MIIFTSFPYVIMTKREYRADKCIKETEACKVEIAELENRNINLFPKLHASAERNHTKCAYRNTVKITLFMFTHS